MKRCPTCNRTFEEDWLAFCTQDGTTLVEDSPAKADEPPPTILAPPPPPAGGWKQPSGDLGSGQFQPQPSQPPPPPQPNYASPSGGFGSAQFQPPPQQQMQAGWQPPPPPPYSTGPKQGMAIASMVCGIFSITIGWCCYLGVLSAPVAMGLGIYQLIQIKNKPEANGGKPMAIVGIITGAAYFLLLALIIVIYGAAIFMQGIK
jgi:hypothetical protein